ncbi:MAG: XTP/dITP diphosphatase [Thermoanaerobacteraceae bacterium]|nr:XTP/dITP diphosphatase [Thermoanaerobacteraceae bacterium]
MNTLVIATKNQGKFLEFKKMLGTTAFNIVSLLEFPEIDIKETGSTFDENALIKASAVCQRTGLPTLADDSGLQVHILNGEPGVFTARYAGEHASDQENINKLLKKLTGVSLDKRQAQFVCSLALVFPDGKTILEKGILEGLIAFSPKGKEGFGYDPVFFVPEMNKTLSEISIDEKNRISHRAKAMEKIKKHLFAYM